MKLSIRNLISFIFGVSALTIRDSPPVNIKAIPSTVTYGNIHANTISTKFNLDGPQLSAVNSSSYEWWYFDAVSPDLKSAVTIVFWTALSSAFPFVPDGPNPLFVSVNVLFANGTEFFVGNSASEAIFTTIGQGTSAIWMGTEVGWVGAPDLSSYEIIVNDWADGITGTFKLKSTAPAHYPCGPAGAGQNMMYYPNIGWSNAIPDAIGEVNFNILGEKYAFTGSAYHDHNWGALAFQGSFVLEFWGRGRLGSYSIVWATITGSDGVIHPTVYVAQNNRILTATCDDSSLTITSLYSNGNPQTGTLKGYLLHIKLGGVKYMDVQANIVGVRSDTYLPVYGSWTGSLNGSVNGGAQITGGSSATFETFNLAQ